MIHSPPRLLILPDFAEENWPSMDLCAEMLTAELSRRGDLAVERFDPRFVPRAGRVSSSAGARNFDRLINRMREYPRQVRAVAGEFDLFHVVDHSYSQLVHELPAGRVGVFCHDLDTFGCVLEPSRHPRPWWFRKMTRKILSGLKRAAVVFYSTGAVRDELVRSGLVDPGKLVSAPPGVAPEFAPRDTPPADPSYVLHVGSCIQRKRIDVLLAVYAGLAVRFPNLRLVQIGGRWTPEQQAQVDRLPADRVEQRRGISRSELAELYAAASLVLLPSEAEGFGLPLIEALACGATVLASDIPVLREVGGDAAVYAPVGDAGAWTAKASELLQGRGVPPAERKRQRSQGFSWARHAEIVATTYRRLVGGESD